MFEFLNSVFVFIPVIPAPSPGTRIITDHSSRRHTHIFKKSDYNLYCNSAGRSLPAIKLTLHVGTTGWRSRGSEGSLMCWIQPSLLITATHSRQSTAVSLQHRGPTTALKSGKHLFWGGGSQVGIPIPLKPVSDETITSFTYKILVLDKVIGKKWSPLKTVTNY